MVEVGGEVVICERDAFVEQVLPTLHDDGADSLTKFFKEDRVTVIFVEDNHLTHLVSLFKP
jgi:hypothetical protein